MPKPGRGQVRVPLDRRHARMIVQFFDRESKREQGLLTSDDELAHDRHEYRELARLFARWNRRLVPGRIWIVLERSIAERMARSQAGAMYQGNLSVAEFCGACAAALRPSHRPRQTPEELQHQIDAITKRKGRGDDFDPRTLRRLKERRRMHIRQDDALGNWLR